MKRKTISIFVFILAMLFIAAPFMVGTFLERHYLETLNLLSQNTKLNYRLINYQKGVFHSTALVAVNFPLADKPLRQNQIDEDNALFINQKIYHGPVMIYRDASLPRFKIGLAYIESIIDKKIIAKSTIALDHSETSLSLKDYQLIKNNKVIYTLSGLAGTITSQASNTKLSANITIHHLIANFNGPREIKNFSLANQQTFSRGLWLGKNQYHFDYLAWQHNETQYAFNGFDYQTKSHITPRGVTLDVLGKVTSATANARNYGPQQIALTFDHMNSQVFTSLKQAFFTDLIEPSGSDSQQLERHLLSLLRKGMHIDIKQFNLTTAWGSVMLKGSIQCPCSKNIKQLSDFFLVAKKQINGQVPLMVALNLVTDYHLLHMSQLNIPLANKLAEQSIIEWQNKGQMIARGTDLFLELRN